MLKPELAMLVSVAASACTVGLDPVPTDVEVTCERDADCPGSLRCHPDLDLCQQPGFDVGDLPRPRVVFVSPADGAAVVSEETTILLVFSLDVDADSVAASTALAPAAGGSPVSLALNAIDTRAYELKPGAALAAETDYRLTVAAGVEAIDGPAGDHEFTSTFTTRVGPDRTPPQTVSNLLMDVRTPSQVALTWTNPDEDFAGVLVLRAAAAEVDAMPTSQRHYQDGDSLGNATVMAATTQTGFVDDMVSDQPYGYAVVAFDHESNYAAPVAAPFVSTTSLRWCPDESAWLDVAVSGVGTQQALVGTTAADLQLGEASPIPATGTATGSELHLPATAFTPGVEHFVRPLVVVAGATYLGRPLRLMADAAALVPVQQPLPVAPGGSGSFAVEAGPWSTFEAEIDVDPVPLVESWQAVTSVVNDGTVEASAQLDARGEVMFRIRPTAASCGVAPWTTSEPLPVGYWRYVSAGVPPGGSGYDPSSPLDSLDAALAIAFADADVYELYVAEGDYAGPFELDREVRILGGWSSDFSARDADNHVTRLYHDGTTGSGGDVPVVRIPSGALVTTATVLDGLRIEKTPTTQSTPTRVTMRIAEPITLSNSTVISLVEPLSWELTVSIGGAGPTLDSNWIIGSQTTTGGTTAVLCDSGCTATLVGNRIDGGTSSGSATAVEVNGGSTAELRDNRIHGGYGSTWGGTGVLAGNSTVNLYGNTIDGGDGVVGNSISNSLAIRFGPGSGGEVIGNRLVSGEASVYVAGIYFNNTIEPAYLANNLIVGGNSGIVGGSRIIAVHNTIGAVGPNGAVAVRSCGGACSLLNNVLFTGAGTNRVGVYNQPSFAQVAVMRNNLFAAVPNGSYVCNWGSLDPDGIDAHDGDDLPTPSGCTAGTDCDTFSASGNMAVAGFIGDVFVDWDGPDNDIRTFDDNDMRLVSSDGSVVGAGLWLDGSQSCGTASVPLGDCGRVDTDFNQAPRTCAPASPPDCTTPGAIEQD